MTRRTSKRRSSKRLRRNTQWYVLTVRLFKIADLVGAFRAHNAGFEAKPKLVKSLRITAIDDEKFVAREDDPRTKALSRAARVVHSDPTLIGVIFDSRSPSPIGYAVHPSQAFNQSGVDYHRYFPFLRKLYSR